MSNLNDMKKKLKRLGAEYKCSESYEIRGKKSRPNEYLERYEHAKFQSEKKQIVIAADNIEILEEMLKYWESKGYEVAGPRYSDHTDTLKLFYWQRIQKKQ